MSTPNDGGPAFPRPAFSEPEDNVRYNEDQEGMSLRDWFAGMAMQGIIAASGKMLINATSNHPAASGELIDHLAGACFEIATAMLKAREK